MSLLNLGSFKLGSVAVPVNEWTIGATVLGFVLLTTGERGYPREVEEDFFRARIERAAAGKMNRQDREDWKKAKKYAAEVFAQKKAEIREQKALERIRKAKERLAAKKARADSPKTVNSIERKEDRLQTIAARIESGEYSPSELRELMASGTLSLRR